jgi:hypothetical protein
MSKTPTKPITSTNLGEHWVRPGKLPAHGFDIGRSQVYQLAVRGEIELVSLKAPGARRGVALVRLDSVRQFIERCRAGNAAEQAGVAA